LLVESGHPGYHNAFPLMSAQQHRYRATVLVLGDLGRSPRMLNHALALAEDGAEVSLCGYQETPVDGAVLSDPRIRLQRIRSLRRAPEGAPRFWFLAVTALRSACLLFESLWTLLVGTPRADAVLVQNPPTVPTLLAAWLAARMRGSSFIIDWHNFGYTMLTARLEPKHFVVQLGKAWECWLGRKADAHFCVSMAMRRILIEEFGLPAPIVLYDKPRELLPFLPVSERSAAARKILTRAGLTLPQDAALAICPTSWSADEDLDLLLEGLELWDSQAGASPRTQLMVLITGRGPLRAEFEGRLSHVSWRRVILRTAFLDPADYRELLRAAHLGFSLHRSSSGVDLPMKIIDLFGARTPALVLDYGACLKEQIQPGRTALTFRDSQEFAGRMDELLQGFPENPQLLERMQRDIETSASETWGEAWRRDAAALFQGR
jgi:beta-1,4-mannosyltransferase